MSYLTPEAKSKLSATIRSLRQRLLEDLQNAGEGMFRLSIKVANQAGLTEANLVKRQRLEQWVEMQVRGYGVYTSQFIIKRDVKSVGRYGKPDSHTCRAN
jgi:hypothetical protein